jgi:putative ABC transport system permease protein
MKAHMRKTWKNLNPDIPFNTYTLEDDLLDRERSRQQVSVFLGAIGAVAIFFSALGLFGLVSYSVRQRKKEIGVRKVLGASTGGIVLLLGKNYLTLILLSNMIGLPLAFFISRLFLTETFPLCPQLGVGFFLLVSSLTVLSSFLALVSQVMKGAAQNPVDSLRYE